MVRRRPGFTLAELVVVMAVGSILAGGIAALLSTQRGQLASLDRPDRWQDQARGALTQLRLDARRAVSVGWGPEGLIAETPEGSVLTYGLVDGDLFVRQSERGRVVLARDVADFSGDLEDGLLRVRLRFSAQIGDFEADAEHATAVWLRPRQGATP